MAERRSNLTVLILRFEMIHTMRLPRPSMFHRRPRNDIYINFASSLISFISRNDLKIENFVLHVRGY